MEVSAGGSESAVGGVGGPHSESFVTEWHHEIGDKQDSPRGRGQRRLGRYVRSGVTKSALDARRSSSPRATRTTTARHGHGGPPDSPLPWHDNGGDQTRRRMRSASRVVGGVPPIGRVALHRCGDLQARFGRIVVWICGGRGLGWWLAHPRSGGDEVAAGWATTSSPMNRTRFAPVSARLSRPLCRTGERVLGGFTRSRLRRHVADPSIRSLPGGAPGFAALSGRGQRQRLCLGGGCGIPRRWCPTPRGQAECR